MATELNPNDPYDRDHLKDPIRTNIGERRSPVEIDNDLQPDPELAEGPASSGRIAMFAVGIAIVLGLVFYGLNSTSTTQQNAATTPAPSSSQRSAETSPPAAPPGMRDVTPRANNQPGTTTGSAPANPQTPSPSSTAPGGANTNTATPGNADKK
jgi:hypothetical protein